MKGETLKRQQLYASFSAHNTANITLHRAPAVTIVQLY